MMRYIVLILELKDFYKEKRQRRRWHSGVCRAKNGLETNEFYRVFEVHPCGIEEYHRYILNFANEYPE